MQLLQRDQTIGKFTLSSARRQKPRPVGLAKGDFKVPAGFDAPLPADVLAGFEGA